MAGTSGEPQLSGDPVRQIKPEATSVTGEDAGCQFPTGPDSVCGRPVARSGAPGRPVKYCDLPGHTRAKAFAVRRDTRRGITGAGQPVDEPAQTPLGRPISYGQASFEALLARFERVAADHRLQLGVIVAEAEALVATVGDADAAAYEVAEAHRAAEIRVAQAEAGRAAAERIATTARKEAASAMEAQAQADAAAEEALDQLERVQTQTAARVAACQAATEQAQTDERAARAELEKVRTEAAGAAARAQEVTEAATQTLIADHDRILAERTADMQRQLEQVKADAQEQIQVLRGELAATTSAVARAEAERAASDRAAERDRVTVAQLRAQLDTERGNYLHQLAEVRREAHDERITLTHAHGEQLAAMLAAIGQTTGHPDITPAPKTSVRRTRGKEQGSKTVSTNSASAPSRHP
jgi:colicin import membrane protein